MRGGRLRNSILIQRQVAGQDTYGAQTDTWETFVTVRASIEPLSGREFFEAAKNNAETTEKIKIRYTPGVTAKMRGVIDNMFYDIQAVLPDRRNREMVLMVVRRVFPSPYLFSSDFSSDFA